MIFLKNKYNDTNPQPSSLLRSGAQRRLATAIVTKNGSNFTTSHYGDSDVKERLEAYSIGKFILEPTDEPKCNYCESYGVHFAPLQVEHYRPKAKVDLKDTAGTPHKGYYWLALDWKNLLLSCPSCNGASAKSNRFPIHGTRAISNICNINLEDGLLINPETADPYQFINFDENGLMHGKGANPINCKGTVTIEILQLNRDSLRIRRLKKWQKFSDEICEATLANQKKLLKFLILSSHYRITAKNILKAKQDQEEYALWGRYINENITPLVEHLPIREVYKKWFLREYKKQSI